MNKADPANLQEKLQLKGPRVFDDTPREPARKTIDGSTGHFGIGTKNMGDRKEDRPTRTMDALMSPCIICCYQECTIQTATHLYASTSKSTNLYAGWMLESPHKLYAANEIPVQDSMIHKALKGDGSALAGNDGLLTVAHRSKVKCISVLALLYMEPKVNAAVLHIDFKHNLGGFDDLRIMNGHLHNTLVNKQQKPNKVKRTLDMVADGIVEHRCRFFVGDPNMAAFSLVQHLQERGIEARLIDYHVELISTAQLRRPNHKNKDANLLLYDSQVIIAIGGLQYRPKMLLPECHMRMGAMVPCRTKHDNNRGFPQTSYLDGSVFPYTSAPAEMVTELRGIEERREELWEQRIHHQVRTYSEDDDREENRTVADASKPFTARWPLLPDLRGVMCRPWLWDPTGLSWSSVAHWPLYVQVGTDRGRTPESCLERNQSPGAQMGIALHKAKLNEISWDAYVKVVAKQMEVLKGPRRNGGSWESYGWRQAEKAKAKAKGQEKGEKGKGDGGRGKGKSKDR